MRRTILLSSLLFLSASLQSVQAGNPREGGSPHPAPHAASPAPHVAQAPHPAAPPMHAAAPRPREIPPIEQPHVAQAPHMAAPPMHAGPPLHEAPHMAEPMHMSQAPHMSTQPTRMPGPQEHMMSRAVPSEQHNFAPVEMRRPGPEEGRAGVQAPRAMPREDALRMEESLHGRALPVTSSSPAQVRSEHQSAMQELEHGRAVQQPLEHNGRMMQLTPGHIAGAAVAGGALAGLAAQHAARPEVHEQSLGERALSPGNGLSRASVARGVVPGARGAAGSRGMNNVPPAPSFANPRQISERSVRAGFSPEPAGSLAYRQGVNLYPRQGNRQGGVPGIYDPGGYVRTPQTANTIINRNFASQQLAMIPNYQSAMAFNQANIVSNRGLWPWQVPQAPAWWNPFSWQSGWGGFGNFFGGNPYPYGDPYAFGPYGGYPFGNYPYGTYGFNPYWNYWNDFGNWDAWNCQYGNCDPFYGSALNLGIFSVLGNLFGGGGNAGYGGYDDFGGIGAVGGGSNNWLANLLYFNSYSIGGNTYPINYFAMNGYVPTPYVFDVTSGQFWQPGAGYSDCLPTSYQGPITAYVQEVLPSFDGRQQITGYKSQPFFYDAFWDNNAQSYGYYDYRSKFHWLTFPGLASYAGQAPVD
jgi:hypothetical protein